MLVFCWRWPITVIQFLKLLKYFIFSVSKLLFTLSNHSRWEERWLDSCPDEDRVYATAKLFWSMLMESVVGTVAQAVAITWAVSGLSGKADGVHSLGKSVSKLKPYIWWTAYSCFNLKWTRKIPLSAAAQLIPEISQSKEKKCSGNSGSFFHTMEKCCWKKLISITVWARIVKCKFSSLPRQWVLLMSKVSLFSFSLFVSLLRSHF